MSQWFVKVEESYTYSYQMTHSTSCQSKQVPLPNLDDFKMMAHSNSSRISFISKMPNDFWKFVNFRGDIYNRSSDSPPIWYFNYKGSSAQQLCPHQAKDVENIYGLFLKTHSCSSDMKWIFTGYKQKENMEIYFDEKNYDRFLKQPGRTALGTCDPPQNISLQTARPLHPVHSNSEVFSEIQKRFREIYNEIPAAILERFPFKIDFLKCTVYNLFHLTNRNNKTGNNKAERAADETMFEQVPHKTNRILIQGAAGFGKTLLTTILAHQWANGVSEIARFSLCLYCNLLNLSFEKEVTEELVSTCVKRLKTIVYSADVVGNSLAENGEKILLLLNGYDMLSEDCQDKVLIFLETSAVFSKSSIVMTTRPTADKNVLKIFPKHVYISGLSTNYFKKYSLLDKRGKNKLDFSEMVEESYLYHLSVLSPYFTWFAFEVLCSGLCEHGIISSLYSFLDYIIQAVISNNMVTTTNRSYDLLDKIGQLSFLALEKGHAYFKLEQLQHVFGEDFGLVVKWNVFCRKDRGGKLWILPSKLLAVFFATTYLRNKWSSLEDDENERNEFLRAVFCLGECKGDYVHGEEAFYYVGLIPEVVLKYLYSDGRSSKSANFEMYHDVERIEYSSSFDSVNLISRISDKVLGRYGFKLRPRSDDMVTTFGGILSSPLSCFQVDNFFYTNDYESKQFLVIQAKRDDEMVLEAILRAKTTRKIDRFYIDFAYYALQDLFHFIRSNLSRHLKDLELPDDMKMMTPMEFVFNLVWLICQCIGERAATVICENTGGGENKTFAMFKICQNTDIKQTVVCVFDNKFRWSEYNKDHFSNSYSELEAVLRNCVSTACDIRININLFL